MNNCLGQAILFWLPKDVLKLSQNEPASAVAVCPALFRTNDMFIRLICDENVFNRLFKFFS